MGLVFIYISIIFLMLYAAFGIFIFLGFYITPLKKSQHPEQQFISIVIPFRNEIENLPGLIESIKKIHYPLHLFEVIFVNDHSTDKGPELIIKSGIKNYTLMDASSEGKKAAIAAGILQAKGSMIAATDADCLLPIHWLEEMNKAGENAMILGPVQLAPVKSLLHCFQEMEWAALQSISASTAHWKIPLMSNGANLAYQKKEFEEAALKKETASGDDIFLLEDFKRKKLSVQFLWDAKSIVKTKPVNNWKELIQQKVRWASKTKYYKNSLNTALGLLIACMNLLLIGNLINFLLFHSTSQQSLMVIISKLIVDLIILLPYLILIKKPFLVFLLPIFVLIYPFYFMYVLTLSLRGKFTWKERNYHV